MTAEQLTLEAIRTLRDQLAGDLVRTPLMRCAGIEDHVGGDTRVFAKLEFLQRTGTFKARGALAVIKGLSEAERRAGVTAVSAGNHAIATAFAAAACKVSAKVVMIRSANPARIAACESYGADVILADDVHSAFATAERIQSQEGRFFVHPFEGPAVAAGTGTVGLEICEQCSDFDAVVVPIGGGGLIAGIATAVKALQPDAAVIGVEPEGADSMHRSFAAGQPVAIDRVTTIADSLGAPFALPYSFSLCRRSVDELVLVSDDELRRMMGFLFQTMKLAVEPACTASTAALIGPLRESLIGKKVVLVMCGSNIDWATFESQAVFERADAT